MVAGPEDVRQSLIILLGTALGERFMVPEYGCNLHQHVFDNMSTSKIHFLRDAIRFAILKHEPRVTVHDVSVDVAMQNEGVIRIAVDYSIQNVNTRFNLVFPYYLSEGTHLPERYHQQIQNQARS